VTYKFNKDTINVKHINNFFKETQPKALSNSLNIPYTVCTILNDTQCDQCSKWYDHQERDQEAKIRTCLHGALHVHFISCSSCHSFTVTDSSVRTIVMADFLAATFKIRSNNF